MSIEQLLAEIEARAAKATPGPCEYGARIDGSMWMSIGSPVTGPHVQADWEFGANNAEAFAASRTDIPRLVAALRVAVEGLDYAQMCCQGKREKPKLAAIRSRLEAALRGE